MSGTRNRVQQWSTVEAYMVASKVDASDSWDDPIGLNYNETGLGPKFTLLFPGNNSARFYWITPDRDWRLNQTYRFKLTSSWINDDEDKEENYFWNVNAFIDSGILIPHGYDGFSCDYVEFSYWKERTRNQVLQESDAKIQFYDFSIGFLDYTSTHLYSPCHKRGGRCRAIDGVVTCGSAMYWQYSLFGILGLILLFCCVVCHCVRGDGGERDKYSLVAPQEDHEDWDDESNVDDEVWQSLKKGAVIEMTHLSLIADAGESDEEYEDEY